MSNDKLRATLHGSELPKLRDPERRRLAAVVVVGAVLLGLDLGLLVLALVIV